MHDYRVVAHNTATASANRIHDDTVARQYGFSGGLVPGVDVYAYMTRPPAEAWGLDWLRRGSLRARFLAPVYDGDEVIVVVEEHEPASSEGRSVALEVRNGAGELCATGEARLQSRPDDSSTNVIWPAAPADSATSPADQPPASPTALAAGTALTLVPHGFHADRAGEYLADVGDGLALYPDAGVAHPGWLLRDANYLLSSNVVLGPWIHVESAIQHHSLVTDGDMVDARGVVTKEWEHKGHRFVELDLGIFADVDRLVARVRHTAIYQPRAARPGA
ncbi:MAG: hypothetical protein ACRD2C_04550 [Acidimicrobiales bacterium]